MDIEEIRNAIVNKEKDSYNRNFLKKLLISKCYNNIRNTTSASQLNYFITEIISDEALTQEEKNNLLNIFKKEMEEKIADSKKFINSLFGRDDCPCKHQKESSVEDEDDKEEEEDTDDNSADNE